MCSLCRFITIVFYLCFLFEFIFKRFIKTQYLYPYNFPTEKQNHFWQSFILKFLLSNCPHNKITSFSAKTKNNADIRRFYKSSLFSASASLLTIFFDSLKLCTTSNLTTTMQHRQSKRKQ